MPKAPETLTQSEAARAIGISPQAIGQWARKPGAPVDRDGTRLRLRWPEFPNWRENLLVQAAKDEARPKNRNEAEERLAAAKAQLAELELEEKRGTLLNREDVIARWSTVGARMRTRLVNLPAKASPFLVAVPTQIEVQTRLERFVDEVITEFREYGAD